MQLYRVTSILSVALLLVINQPAWSQENNRNIKTLMQELGLEEADTPIREHPDWRKPERIYINFARYGTSDELDMLRKSAREVAGDIAIVEVGNRLDADVLEDVEVLISRCYPDQLQHAKRLVWMQHSSHGMDACITPAIKKMNFIYTNAQHTSGPPIAEHVIAMMMMMGRGLHLMHTAQLEHKWLEDINFPVVEMKGKTMLVVGLGGIGTEVAERAHALGMNILAIRNSRREGPDFIEYVGLSHETFDLAARADVIVNALPLTPETNGMFNKDFFNAVKHGAYYISIGRGETTVTDDLVAALKDGRITAAGMDVTDPEPLPPGHELWSLPNVVITPHMASATDQGRWRRWAAAMENLRRYIDGDKLLSVVDKERGY